MWYIQYAGIFFNMKGKMFLQMESYQKVRVL